MREQVNALTGKKHGNHRFHRFLSVIFLPGYRCLNQEIQGIVFRYYQYMVNRYAITLFVKNTVYVPLLNTFDTIQLFCFNSK